MVHNSNTKASSDWGAIETGVPQGSVLGPFLFLVHVNDIVKEVSCGLKLFADDTLLYITVNNPELSAVELNKNMDKLNNWARQELVNLNATKTKSMNIFKKESSLYNYPVISGNEILNTVSHYKHFGIIIGEKLNCSVYVYNILESVGKLCNVFVKLKQLIDRKTLTDTYVAVCETKA